MEVSKIIVVRNGHPVGFQRNPDVIPAMRQAAALVEIDTALTCAGYDAGHNHRLCRREMSVRQTVIRLNPRNTVGRWPKTPNRRAMLEHFDKPLYNQR